MLVGVIHGGMYAYSIAFRFPNRVLFLWLMMIPLLCTAFLVKPSWRVMLWIIVFSWVLDWTSEIIWTWRIRNYPSSWSLVYVESSIFWTLVGAFHAFLLRAKTKVIFQIALIGTIYGFTKAIVASSILGSLKYDDSYESVRFMLNLVSPVVGLLLITIPIRKAINAEPLP
jgi:hypothetical protein